MGPDGVCVRSVPNALIVKVHGGEFTIRKFRSGVSPQKVQINARGSYSSTVILRNPVSTRTPAPASSNLAISTADLTSSFEQMFMR